MRKLSALALPVLLVFALFVILQSRPSAPRVVPKLAPSAGVTRVNGRTEIDLNRASEELLMTIPGVGPVLAGRIRARIEEGGALSSPEDLLDVEGIGLGKLKEIKANSVVIP
jgi:competence protein ComEA